MNAKGVPSFSPGLRSQDRSPGIPSRPTIQPQRGCGPCAVNDAPMDGTALQFGMSATATRVGLIAFDQRRAGGWNPVGIRMRVPISRNADIWTTGGRPFGVGMKSLPAQFIAFHRTELMPQSLSAVSR